jgi:regulator of RNase E activity RraB
MFLKKKSLALKSSLFIAASMIFVACGSEAGKEDPITAVAEDTVQAEAETQEITYSLPSPLQIASIFKKSGLKYKAGITSTFKDPSKYTTNLNKALNLGVYSADLSYAVLNKQNQEAMNYMKLSRQLADNLGMGSVFEQGNLSARFEKNLSNEDSLAYIIAELQMVTDMYLDENDQQQITSIVFSGAWIESMYIGSKVYEKGKDKSLNNKLAEQMTILGSIINALKAEEKKDAAISGLIAELESIKVIYDGLPSVKNNPEGEDNSEVELTLTDDEVTQLTTKIEAIRTKFING